MDTPIACSLTADGQRQRADEARMLARDALLRSEPLPGGLRLRFAATDDVRERLERFVAAEAACCPFLRLDLVATDTALTLDVTGPDEARPVIDELFSGAPAPRSAPARSAPSRPVA